MGNVTEWILLGTMVWAVGVTSLMIWNNVSTARRLTNQLLSLTDKQAAVTAASIDRAEKTPPLTAKEIAEKKEKKKQEIKDQQMYDEIALMTTLTPEAEQFLQERGEL